MISAWVWNILSLLAAQFCAKEFAAILGKIIVLCGSTTKIRGAVGLENLTTTVTAVGGLPMEVGGCDPTGERLRLSGGSLLAVLAMLMIQH